MHDGTAESVPVSLDVLGPVESPDLTDDDYDESANPSLAAGDKIGSKAASGFRVNTAACTGKSAKDLFAAVAEQLGWPEVDVEARPSGGVLRRSVKPTIYCVMNSKDLLERMPIRRNSWVTRYIGAPDLCDKGNLARMFMIVADFVEEGTFNFNPRTWVLPEQCDLFRSTLEKSKKTFIVKPEDGSQGDGIFLVQGLRDFDVKMSVKSSKEAVAQRYLDKPLLLGGVKFDFRLYVCLLGGSVDAPPQVFLCREGLARFCTEVYEEPTQKNMHKCMGHLTNYSLNKRSDKFEHSAETTDLLYDISSTASKRPLTLALQQLQQEHPLFDIDEFYTHVTDIVATTVALMAPALLHYHRKSESGSSEMRSLQVLGFDVMLDKDLNPYLLEVNNSPSLCIDEALPLDVDEAAEYADRASRPARTREKTKVCLCMDMAQPHRHQTSLVDLAIKKTAMVGVFRLLMQVRRGVHNPEDAAYINIDVGSHDAFGFLQGVEALFHRCGGASKVFTGAGLRRLLGPICSSGALEKHDLDTLAQRFRASRFAVRDREVHHCDALRMFDFLEVLKQASARAYPGEPPRQAVDRILATIG